MRALSRLQIVRWLSKPLHLLSIFGVLIPFTVLVRYMQQNGRNIPRFDQWRSYPIAFAAQDGTLTFSILVNPFGEHITFFSYLTTAIFTLTTDWNIRAEMWVNLCLGAFCFLLYVLLFSKTEQRVLPIVLVPFAFLVFMLRQDFNWTLGYYAAWWWAQFFWLLALVMLVYFPNRWGALGGAVVLAFFSTISMAAGIVTWVAILIYMVMKLDRNWNQILVWIVATIGSVIFYLSIAQSSSATLSDIYFITFVQSIYYMFAQLGIFFEAVSRVWFVASVGLLGCVILLFNLLHLRLDGGNGQEYFALWGSVAAYGLGTAYLIGLARINETGIERIFFSWYSTTLIPFWVGLVAVMAVVVWRLMQRDRKRWYEHGLLYANVLFSGCLMLFYYPSNQTSLGSIHSTTWRGVTEDCMMRYIFIQDDMPYCTIINPEVYQYNQLAARRLALYATREVESILHENAIDNNPIFVETHTAWLNTHIRDFFLDGVDRQRIYHVYPSSPDIESEIPDPPEQTFTDFSDDGVKTLLDFFGKLDSFWYIRRVDYDTSIPDFWDELTQRGYLIVDTRARNDGMLVSRVQLVPPTLDNSPRFGDAIRMRAVTSVSDVVAPCGAITLETFWMADAEIALDYSGSLRLNNVDGDKVAQSDAQLSVVGTRLWEQNELYADNRELMIPCDLPSGDYQLVLAVYFYQSPSDLLPITGDETRIKNNLYQITTVTVN